jgi:tetratricopeptide (TPR) repeat protein
MLWYQDIYFDVAQEYQRRDDPDALMFLKRGLAHCLHLNEGDNAESFLRDIAEVLLWQGKFDESLSLYTALIRNEPDNIWHYNSIALTSVDSGLAQLGIEAAERGISLISATGDPERLDDQFRNSLTRLVADAETDRVQNIEPTILTDFRDSLTLGFNAGRGLPYPMLAHDLVPDLRSFPVNGAAEMPTLPPTSARRPELSPQRHQSPSRAQSLKRNEPCWCGSGKKYKNCHMRANRDSRRNQS